MNTTTYIPAADILRPAALATEGVTLETEWLPNGLGCPSPALICGHHALSMDEGGVDDAGVMIYTWSAYLRNGETWDELMGSDDSGYENEARAAALDWAEWIRK